MPVYVGDLPIDALLDDTGEGYDLVYVGSDQVWPPIEFPYVIENSSLDNATRPEGAAGALVELIGAGGPGKSGQVMPSQNNVVAAGGDGGGGGAAIGSAGLRFFIPVEDLGPTFSTLVGSSGASRFVSGGIDLIAGAGTNSAGGTPTIAGIGYGYSAPGSLGDNGAGGAAGGGQGRTAQTDSNKRVSYTPGTAGSNSLFKNGGAYATADPVPDAGKPSGGAGGGVAGRGYGAGGGGGSGQIQGTPVDGSGKAGGPGYLRVTWTDKRHAFARFTAAGAWSWTLPAWLRNGDKIRLTGLGGGRGGNQGGSTSGGAGGRAGAWGDVELTVGVDIALGGTLVGGVGTGGAINGGNGGNTTCTTVGFTALGATAAVAGTATAGESAETHAYLDDLYIGGLGGAYGGLDVGGDGGPGSGGGGGGSLFFQGKNGGKGGDGRLFIHAYQV